MEVECPDCDLWYFPDDPDSAACHAWHHEKVTAPDRPEPDPQIAEWANRVGDMIIFEGTDPDFLHAKLYRISFRFKCEMKYDSADWAPKGSQLKRGAIGVLFCEQDGTALGGAGIYAKPPIGNASHMIAWVWIAPTYRQKGVLQRALPALAERFPGAFIQPDYSEGMERLAKASPYIVNKDGPLFLIG